MALPFKVLSAGFAAVTVFVFVVIIVFTISIQQGYDNLLKDRMVEDMRQFAVRTTRVLDSHLDEVTNAVDSTFTSVRLEPSFVNASSDLSAFAKLRRFMFNEIAVPMLPLVHQFLLGIEVNALYTESSVATGKTWSTTTNMSVRGYTNAAVFGLSCLPSALGTATASCIPHFYCRPDTDLTTGVDDYLFRTKPSGILDVTVNQVALPGGNNSLRVPPITPSTASNELWLANAPTYTHFAGVRKIQAPSTVMTTFNFYMGGLIGGSSSEALAMHAEFSVDMWLIESVGHVLANFTVLTGRTVFVLADPTDGSLISKLSADNTSVVTVQEHSCFSSNTSVAECREALAATTADPDPMVTLALSYLKTNEALLSARDLSQENGGMVADFADGKKYLVAGRKVISAIKAEGVNFAIVMESDWEYQHGSHFDWKIIFLIIIALACAVVTAEGIIFMQRKVMFQMDVMRRGCEDAALLDFKCLDEEEHLLVAQNVVEMRDLALTFCETLWSIKAFSRYLSKEVLMDLSYAGALATRKMESKMLTVMFTDIAGFTTMCESLTTDDLMELAERYFNVAARTLVLHGCTIDKYIGDAIVGFWGAPLEYHTQGFSACAAALHLHTVVQRLKPFFSEFRQQLNVRVGIHRGAALVGNLGCKHRVTYTALGSTVNTAAKLEERNKKYGTEILVSEAVIADANETQKDLFVFRCVGHDDDNSTNRHFELVGVRKSEVSKIEKTEAEQPSTHRRHSGYRPTDEAFGMDLISEAASDAWDASPSGESLAIGRNSSGALGSGVALGLPDPTKTARLSLTDEINVLMPSYFLEREAVNVMTRLGNAFQAAYNGYVDDALTTTKHIVEEDNAILERYDISTHHLERCIAQWKRIATSGVSSKTNSTVTSRSALSPKGTFRMAFKAFSEFDEEEAGVTLSSAANSLTQPPALVSPPNKTAQNGKKGSGDSEFEEMYL